MNLHIDTNWSFKTIILHIENIKEEFIGKLASFSYFHLHEKVLFIKDIRNSIYSLPILEWQCDKIWEYLNDNIELKNLTKYL